MVKEFKEFISKGNVLDLAVGVIIGGAFGKIVSSLVSDVLMPIIGVITGGVDFTTLSITIKDASVNYGLFIQNIIDFLIVAFCVFIMVKLTNKFRKKEVVVEKKVTKSEEVILLTEIRDTLKKKTK